MLTKMVTTVAVPMMVVVSMVDDHYGFTYSR